MSSLRASAVPLCIAALAAASLLSGCASRRLSSRAPPGVHFAGDWKLDSSRSDDLGRAIAQLRAQDSKLALERRRAAARAAEAGEGGEGGRGEGAGAGPGAGEQINIGPGPHVSGADELMANVPQGSYLRITASPDSLTVTSGDASNQYTPGLESAVSAQQGDAQQISGWKGAEFVIDTQPQWGPEIIQSYGLTKDGRLRVTVRLTGGGTNFTFTSIYDRTTHVSPLAPPTND
ncbi:MAG: hypothetical protein HIU85_17765 [Proteobacteria bacterium]|nr:hypothetical protein [Pseudomonadota bacterium]